MTHEETQVLQQELSLCPTIALESERLVHVHQKSVWELFDLDRLVVLSPDAEEDLDIYEI